MLAVFGLSPSPTPTGPAISGVVTYGDTGRPVPNAVIVGSWSNGGYVMTLADVQGVYELRNFQPTGTYTIRAIRNGRHDGAISSFDAAQIAQFVTSLRTFTDIQKLAADVSLDGAISSFDAGVTAGYVVGIYPEHQQTYWASPNVYVHTNITQRIQGENYKMILLGDITENWTPRTPSPSPTPVILNPSPWPSPTVIPIPTMTLTPCPTPVCGRAK